MIGHIKRLISRLLTPPPVNRENIDYTGKFDGDHRELKADGQQKAYKILSDDERAKGFVRPVRDSYLHVGIRPTHPLRDLTEPEKIMWASAGYSKYEQYPAGGTPVGRFYKATQLKPRCGGALTTMGRRLAETYARDPKFYGGTFCAACGEHFPVEEFVWDGTNEVLGS